MQSPICGAADAEHRPWPDRGDSGALLPRRLRGAAWLFRERGELLVDRIHEHAALSTVNPVEVLHCTDEQGVATEGLPRDLQALGVRIVPFSEKDAALVDEVRRAVRRQGARLSWPNAAAWRPASASTSRSSAMTRPGTRCTWGSR